MIFDTFNHNLCDTSNLFIDILLFLFEMTACIRVCAFFIQINDIINFYVFYVLWTLSATQAKGGLQMFVCTNESREDETT